MKSFVKENVLVIIVSISFQLKMSTGWITIAQQKMLFPIEIALVKFTSVPTVVHEERGVTVSE